MKYLIKNHGVSLAYACMQDAGCLPFQLKKPALETVAPTCMHVAGVCAECGMQFGGNTVLLW